MWCWQIFIWIYTARAYGRRRGIWFSFMLYFNCIFSCYLKFMALYGFLFLICLFSIVLFLIVKLVYCERFDVVFKLSTKMFSFTNSTGNVWQCSLLQKKKIIPYSVGWLHLYVFKYSSCHNDNICVQTNYIYIQTNSNGVSTIANFDHSMPYRKQVPKKPGLYFYSVLHNVTYMCTSCTFTLTVSTNSSIHIL